MVERVHKLIETKRQIRRPRGPSPLLRGAVEPRRLRNARGICLPPSVDRSWKSQISTCVAEPLSRLSGFADLLSTPVSPETPSVGVGRAPYWYRGRVRGSGIRLPPGRACSGRVRGSPDQRPPAQLALRLRGSDPPVSSSGLTSARCFPPLVLPQGLGWAAWLLHTMPELHLLI